MELKRDNSIISKLRPTLIGQLEQPVLGGTELSFKNYKNHFIFLNDPDYVTNSI
jgi:hypothetical protein